jgi:hypothetical protein
MWTVFLHLSPFAHHGCFSQFSRITYTTADNTYEYSPSQPVKRSPSNLLNFHRLARDESWTDRTNHVRAIRKVWLEVFAIPTVVRVHHVSPARYAPGQKAQNDRDQKGDRTFTLFHGYRVVLLLRILQVIGTHNGTFHCDEALAVYMLRQTSTYADAGLLRRLLLCSPPLKPPLGRLDPNERPSNFGYLRYSGRCRSRLR